jgi:hypothetical protein
MRLPDGQIIFDFQCVGWVERSETQGHETPALMGFAALYPSYEILPHRSASLQKLEV